MGKRKLERQSKPQRQNKLQLKKNGGRLLKHLAFNCLSIYIRYLSWLVGQSLVEEHFISAITDLTAKSGHPGKKVNIMTLSVQREFFFSKQGQKEIQNKESQRNCTQISETVSSTNQPGVTPKFITKKFLEIELVTTKQQLFFQQNLTKALQIQLNVQEIDLITAKSNFEKVQRQFIDSQDNLNLQTKVNTDVGNQLRQTLVWKNHLASRLANILENKDSKVVQGNENISFQKINAVVLDSTLRQFSYTEYNAFLYPYDHLLKRRTMTNKNPKRILQKVIYPSHAVTSCQEMSQKLDSFHQNNQTPLNLEQSDINMIKQDQRWRFQACQYFGSTIVNIYGRLLSQRSDIFPRGQIIDSFALNISNDLVAPMSPAQIYKYIRSKETPCHNGILIMPFNFQADHWVLFVVDPIKQMIDIVDPFQRKIQPCQRYINNFKNNIVHPWVLDRLLYTVPFSSQDDATYDSINFSVARSANLILKQFTVRWASNYTKIKNLPDCGVFICLAMEVLHKSGQISQLNHISQLNCEDARKNIEKEIDSWSLHSKFSGVDIPVREQIYP